MPNVTESKIVSKEVVVKDKDCSSYFFTKPVSDIIGVEDCSPVKINLG